MTTLTRKKVRLSLLVYRAQRMYLYLMGTIIVVLGALYLFMLNSVTMSGYVLTQEAREQQELIQAMQELDAFIAQKESREFISESTVAKSMEQRVELAYKVVSPIYTAQKKTLGSGS